MIHIGNQRTLTTRCGKPVARRWWVGDERVRHGHYGPLAVYEELDPTKAADCRECVAAFSGEGR